MDRIGIYRRMFEDPRMEKTEEIPFTILSNLSAFGIPKEDVPVLKKVLSRCQEKFIEAITAETMVSASIAVSGIAYRIHTEPALINGLFRDIIVAYGKNPELRDPDSVLEIHSDEDDVWGEAKIILANAEYGNADEQYSIGMRYLTGEGVTPSDERYLSWISRSAGQHYSYAELEMWKILTGGRFGDKDPEQAKEWLYNAAVHGCTEARELCVSEGIPLELGICEYCGKNRGKYMTADGPICSVCMPRELMEMCAQVTKDAVEKIRPIRSSFIC